LPKSPKLPKIAKIEARLYRQFMNPQTKVESNVQQAVPFFRVSTMETSLRFYVGGLGFEMTKKWTPDGDGKARWCWLH